MSRFPTAPNQPLHRPAPALVLGALLAASTLAAAPAPARAQIAATMPVPTFATAPAYDGVRPPALEPGEEVRVSWRDDRYTYADGGIRVMTAEVAAVTETALMVRRGKALYAIPLGSLRTVQRRIGTKPATAPEMVAGSAGGFAVGFLVGFATGGIEGGGSDVDRTEAGLTTGVLIGAPLGALIAWAASRSRGIYEDVPFREVLTAMVVEPGGRVGFRIPVGNR